MFRLNKMTDYGLMLLTHFAKNSARTWSARDLAAQSHVPLPTVSKLLKLLSKSSVLESHRGTAGGYRLLRPAGAITVAEIIAALEGPVALTECAEHKAASCMLESNCPVKGHWQKISAAVNGALENLTLEQLSHPISHFGATQVAQGI